MRIKIDVVLIAFLGLFFLLLMPAWADTDYQCLKLCVQGGHNSSECMKQCTYDSGTHDTTGKAQSQLQSGLANNRVLPTFLQNDPNTILNARKPTSEYNKSEDYVCAAQCLKSNVSYQMCSESCTSVTKKNGDVIKKAVQINLQPKPEGANESLSGP
jgi:hypothetical protein